MTNEVSARSNATFLVCVSDMHESEVALRFACRRAQNRHAKVALLHVTEPADFQGLFSVSDVMRQEQQERAKMLLQQMEQLALHYCDEAPILLLREGKLGEEIINTTLENGDIIAVVMGVQHDSPNAAKLLSWLTSKLGQELLVPLIAVPGNLTDAQIEALV